ncbi:MAG: S8/S53 family peptidase [Ginsengibacter sp.]
MATFIVNVSKLNLRSSPVNDFTDKRNVVGVLQQGCSFESAGEITNEMGKWQVDRDGHWAWENGLEEKLIQDSVSYPPLKSTGENVKQYLDARFDGINFKSLIDYNFLLNIPGEIKRSKGKGAVIGILDQPISTNIIFKNILRPGNITTLKSPSAHGNFIAGIIGNMSGDTILGICPMATILDLTFNDIYGNLIIDNNHYDKLIKCVKSFDDKKVIINVSRAFDESLKFVMDKFKEVMNIIFVCAAGANDELLNIQNCASVNYDNAISVGIAAPDFWKDNSLKIDKRLDIIFPIIEYVSLKSDGQSFSRINDLSGSWGNAVASCMVALLYSDNLLNINSSKMDIVSKVQLFSKNLDSYNFLNPLKL